MKRFLKRSRKVPNLPSGTTKNMIRWIMTWQNLRCRWTFPRKFLTRENQHGLVKLIQDVERYGAPEGSLRENKRPHIYLSYKALLLDIIDVEPSNFEDVVGKQVWKDAMHEEY